MLPSYKTLRMEAQHESTRRRLHSRHQGIDNSSLTSGCKYLFFVCRSCLRGVAWFSYWFNNLGLITEGNTYCCCATSWWPHLVDPRDPPGGLGTLPIKPETFPVTKTGFPIYKSLPPDHSGTPRDVRDLIQDPE